VSKLTLNGELIMRRSASEIIRNLEMRVARLEANLNRTASMTREAAGRAQLEGVESDSAYHDGQPLGGSMSAMLYLIGADENKSKFYEMVLDGETVQILYGRLGSTGRRADKTFSNTREADAFFDKQLRAKLNKGYVSAFSQKGQHRKNGPLYGRYPIGLTSNPGPWVNQDIAYAQGMITDTISVVRAAITSFQDDGIVDEGAVAMLMSTQRSLSTHRDQLSQECANEIRIALDRIQGTGRAGRQPVEVRTRTAIAGLQKLMRKLEGAMSGGHRRASRGYGW
jgi:predicted DNA-binding WGR domain protein